MNFKVYGNILALGTAICAWSCVTLVLQASNKLETIPAVIESTQQFHLPFSDPKNNISLIFNNLEIKSQKEVKDLRALFFSKTTHLELPAMPTESITLGQSFIVAQLDLPITEEESTEIQNLEDVPDDQPEELIFNIDPQQASELVMPPQHVVLLVERLNREYTEKLTAITKANHTLGALVSNDIPPLPKQFENVTIKVTEDSPVVRADQANHTLGALSSNDPMSEEIIAFNGRGRRLTLDEPSTHNHSPLPEFSEELSLLIDGVDPFEDAGIIASSITTFTASTPHELPTHSFELLYADAHVSLESEAPQEDPNTDENVNQNIEASSNNIDSHVENLQNNTEDYYLNPNLVHVILEPVSRATLSSQINSTIIAINRKMGQSFKAGEPLIRLDDTIFSANLNKAISVFKQAKLNSDMRQQLYEDDIGSLTELKEAEAKTATALAELAVARKQFEACTIVAPYPGRVVDVRVQEYELAQVNQPLIDIIGDAILIGKMLIDVSQFQNIAIGDVINIHFESANVTVPAKIIRIGAEIDPASSTIRVDAYIENNNAALTAGMTGVAILPQKNNLSSENNGESKSGG